MIRPYQTQAIDELRNALTQFRRVLLWLATGAGKTFIFCKITRATVMNGGNVLIMVRGRKLVHQACQRLGHENVNHGVFMSGHWNYRPHMPVQVCSIDTLISRGARPKADLIIIDEAHLASSKGYKTVLSDYPDVPIISVTATPYVDSGLTHVAETIVHPISMLGLIAEGYLAPFRPFAPSTPDLSKVKVSSSTKDYVVEQLFESVVSGTLMGNIVKH